MRYVKIPLSLFVRLVFFMSHLGKRLMLGDERATALEILDDLGHCLPFEKNDTIKTGQEKTTQQKDK